MTKRQCIKWLCNYGYLPHNKPTDCQLKKAIKSAQEYLGIVADGDFGSVTKRAMQQLRCSVPDTEGMGRGTCKWPNPNITFGFSRYLKDLGQEQLDITVKFLEAVEAVCGARFTLTQSAPNIIYTTSSDRGSGLGSSGGTLAYAQLPCSANPRQMVVTYDEAERWTNQKPAQGRIVFYNVGLHETLHALGISHRKPSGKPSLMDPTYNEHVYELGEYEIDELVMRYGKPTKVDPKPDEPPKLDPLPGRDRVVIDSNDFRITVEGKGVKVA